MCQLIVFYLFSIFFRLVNTSRVKWKENTDLLILPDQMNGLKKPSLIRIDKIATLEIELIIGKIGVVGEDEIIEINSKLKQLLGLD